MKLMELLELTKQLQQTQVQLRQTQAQLQQTKVQLQQTQAQLRQTQAQLQQTQAQQEIILVVPMHRLFLETLQALLKIVNLVQTQVAQQPQKTQVVLILARHLQTLHLQQQEQQTAVLRAETVHQVVQTHHLGTQMLQQT